MNEKRKNFLLWIPIFTIVLAEAAHCRENAASHSIRHHQVGVKQKKNSAGDIDVNEIGNGTEDVFPAATTTTTTENPTMPDLVVRPHEEVRLRCYIPEAALSPRQSTGPSWLHDGQVVDSVEIGIPGTGHRYSRDPVNGHLHISNIRLEDDGFWQCQYHDQNLDHVLSSKPLRLIVLDRPRNPYLEIDGRRLDPGNLFIPVKENTELSVTCVVEGGNPPPTIKWSLLFPPSSDQFFGEDNSVRVSLNVTDVVAPDVASNRVHSHTHTRSEARLENILRGHHNATVMCLAHHVTLPSALNASLLLDVQYSPSFAISREPGFGFPIREGIPVSLKCDVDSNPPSSPVWQKDDMSPPVAQSGDGFLNFSAIKREHSGWYKCTSHHLLGDFSSIGYFLNVRYDPVVEVTQDPGLETVPTGRQIEVALGGAVQLQCPEDIMGCWSRVGVGGRLEAVGPGPGLALEDILYQDAGEYRCVAGRRNSYDKWRSEINVDVTVKGRPVVYPANTSVTAYTGQELNFSVEFCANPPASAAFWITESQRLRPGRVTPDFVAHNITAGSSIHCQQALLTLKRVQTAHEGEYIFLVRSPKGLAEGSIVLNVTRVSGYFSAGSRRESVEGAIFLLLLLPPVLLLHRHQT